MRLTSAILLVLVTGLFTACGGGGGGSDPAPTTPTTPTNPSNPSNPSNPTPTGIQLSALFQQGSYIEFAVNTETTTFVQPSSTSSSSDFGIFRVMLGAPTTISGATVFPITVSGDADVGGINFAPRWTHMGIRNGSLVGSANGSTLQTIYNAETPTAVSAGFFITFGATENVTPSNGTFTAEYNTLAAVLAGHSSSSGGCETFFTIQICSDSSTSFSETEYYKDGVGPIGYRMDISFSSSGGGVFSSTQIRRRVEIVGTSLTPVDNAIIRPAPWRELASLNTARSQHSAAAFNGKIYVFGGAGNSSGVSTTVEIYDPLTNTWVPGAAIPNGLLNSVARTVGDKIYVIPTSSSLALHIYDPVLNSWSFGATHTAYDDPSQGGDVMTLNTGPNAGTFIFLVTPNGGSSTQMVMAAYRVASNTWFSGINNSIQRRWTAVTAVGDDLYTIGGFIPADFFNPATVTGLTRRFNIETAVWSGNLAALRVVRHSAQAVTLNGEPVVLGGTSSTTSATQLREVEAFNTSTGVWRDLPSMLRRRQDFAAVVLDGKIYVIGGLAGSTRIASVEVYTP
jgi:hypothetical protein